MSTHEQDLTSSLVGLANLARARLAQTNEIEKTREAISKLINHDRIVIISATELCEISFTAKSPDQPSVGDINSHNDRWIDGNGSEIGKITGEGWKIANLNEDVISYYRETADTISGRIEIAGLWNSSAIWRNCWQSLPAMGVTGELTGMLGVRQLYQEIPRKRYRAFVLLIPIEAINNTLRNKICRGYASE